MLSLLKDRPTTTKVETKKEVQELSLRKPEPDTDSKSARSKAAAGINEEKDERRYKLNADMGKAVVDKCKCGRCKWDCKLPRTLFKPDFHSVYQLDFLTRDFEDSKLIIPNSIYETKKTPTTGPPEALKTQYAVNSLAFLLDIGI
jgi:hypothetical protein